MSLFNACLNSPLFSNGLGVAKNIINRLELEEECGKTSLPQFDLSVFERFMVSNELIPFLKLGCLRSHKPVEGTETWAGRQTFY